ncbi:hypothetical protein [Aurantiacibacter hainanensis]|uniref:hypothetical protein n=1 Tax=Aurantiacibacter hainanensis TaxID=3076114 RepID=UPI0030C763F7
MSMFGQALGLFALVPAMAGAITLPEEGGAAELILALCQGGTIAIPFTPANEPATPATVCCAKGCQRREKRDPVDPEQ